MLVAGSNLHRRKAGVTVEGLCYHTRRLEMLSRSASTWHNPLWKIVLLKLARKNVTDPPKNSLSIYTVVHEASFIRRTTHPNTRNSKKERIFFMVLRICAFLLRIKLTLTDFVKAWVLISTLWCETSNDDTVTENFKFVKSYKSYIKFSRKRVPIIQELYFVSWHSENYNTS